MTFPHFCYTFGMEEVYYFTLQKQHPNGKKGSWIYKKDELNNNLSPIFADCHGLFQWMKFNKWRVIKEVKGQHVWNCCVKTT